MIEHESYVPVVASPRDFRHTANSRDRDPPASFWEDRRSGERFPICQRLSFTIYLGRKRVVAGTGTTIDIGSKGVLFTYGRTCPEGCTAKLSMDWPALAHDGKPMKLYLSGFVVRSDDRGTAVRIVRHAFETMRDDRLIEP